MGVRNNKVPQEAPVTSCAPLRRPGASCGPHVALRVPPVASWCLPVACCGLLWLPGPSMGPAVLAFAPMCLRLSWLTVPSCG